MKQDIPKVNDPAPEKSLAELTPEEISSKLASFKEVLKSKDIDAYSLLGLEKPVEKVDVNKAKIAELLPKYEEVRSSLLDSGYKFPTESKLTDGERAIMERVEKQGKAKFAEQKEDILKADPDFPVDLIEKLEDVPIEGKLAVMSAAKSIISRNSEAISKLKKELDTANAQLKDVKMMAPAEEKGDQTGQSKVSQTRAKFGMKVEEEKDNPDKTDK